MENSPQQKGKASSPAATTISGVEWALVIGFLFLSDLVQAGLDLLVIGVIVNRILSVLIGFALAFYLQLRGQNIMDIKRLGGLLVSLLGEEVPEVDALPFWTLDGIYNYSLYKASHPA